MIHMFGIAYLRSTTSTLVMLKAMLYSVVIVEKILRIVKQVSRTVQHKQGSQRVILRDLSELCSLV